MHALTRMKGDFRAQSEKNAELAHLVLLLTVLFVSPALGPPFPHLQKLWALIQNQGQQLAGCTFLSPRQTLLGAHSVLPDEPRLDFQVSLRCGAPGNHLVLDCLQETTWTWPPLQLQWLEFYSVKSLQSPLCPVGCWGWPKFSHQLPRAPYPDSVLSFTARTLALTLPSSVWALI